MNNKENFYLFIALILIISTNVYFSCRLLPNQEGFMKKVKKEMDKVGKSIEKNVLNKVTDLIKNTIIKPPIMVLPKPIRSYFLKEINFKKDLGTVIKQLLFVIVKASMMIMVLVPVMNVLLMPLITSFFSMLFTTIANMLMQLMQPPDAYTKPDFKNQNLVQPEIRECNKKTIKNGVITCDKS